MENLYLIILCLLACIAIFDLFVGVSNDAVNFLNSAIGSRVASFRTTMIVASAGVLLGATFSSGMMEIARSGIFHPQLFSFHEIMIIFLAVMVADIILLDTFNSLGLPTSTTVSIVFELLGAALAAAMMKLLMDGSSMGDIMSYINSSKALTIISGILISVVVAFVCGVLVQYVMRLIFTFHIEKAYSRFGALFGALCLTAIIYFLVMKGAKGASFMRPEWLAWIKEHTSIILSSIFIGSVVLFQVMISVFKANIFKVIILAGTFSLAFAFAGNDLVNFVGVPLAAYDSWIEWNASQTNPNDFFMAGLLKPSQAPTAFLLLSGAVMVATLWFSRKAHRVIRTSINLSSSQSGQHEQFGSSLPGRIIVRASMGFNHILQQIIPAPIKKGIASRFTPKELKKGEEALPFDYIRASVNLMVSAILIASATSLKLPLSTTYVTFMVAMGSSFADGAWDRETAVYRISGVLTVISGWFVTAISASCLAGLVAILIFWGGSVLALVFGIVALGYLVYQNVKADSEETTLKESKYTRFDSAEINQILQHDIGLNYQRTVNLYGRTLEAFFAESGSQLRSCKSDSLELLENLNTSRSLYFLMNRSEYQPSKSDQESRYCYYRACANMREVAKGLNTITRLAKDHVANRHRVYKHLLKQDMIVLLDLMHALNAESHLDEINKQCALVSNQIEEMQSTFLKGTMHEEVSVRGVEMYLTLLNLARELVSRYEIAFALREKILSLSKQDTTV